MLTYIAVKTNKVEDILEILDNHFSKNYSLSIWEVRFGGKDTKYTKGESNFENWEDFRKTVEVYREKNKVRINSDFDLYHSLEEHEEWTILKLYPRRYARGYYRNSDLIELTKKVSKEIKCDALFYQHDDTTGYTHIMYYTNGEVKDGALYSDSEQTLIGGGYFEELNGLPVIDSYQKFNKKYLKFFSKINFDPEATELNSMNPKTWRRFYLEGDTQDLVNYLEGEKREIFFDNILKDLQKPDQS